MNKAANSGRGHCPVPELSSEARDPLDDDVAGRIAVASCCQRARRGLRGVAKRPSASPAALIIGRQGIIEAAFITAAAAAAASSAPCSRSKAAAAADEKAVAEVRPALSAQIAGDIPEHRVSSGFERIMRISPTRTAFGGGESVHPGHHGIIFSTITERHRQNCQVSRMQLGAVAKNKIK